MHLRHALRHQASSGPAAVLLLLWPGVPPPQGSRKNLGERDSGQLWASTAPLAQPRSPVTSCSQADLQPSLEPRPVLPAQAFPQLATWRVPIQAMPTLEPPAAPRLTSSIRGQGFGGWFCSLTDHLRSQSDSTTLHLCGFGPVT